MSVKQYSDSYMYFTFSMYFIWQPQKQSILNQKGCIEQWECELKEL